MAEIKNKVELANEGIQLLKDYTELVKVSKKLSHQDIIQYNQEVINQITKSLQEIAYEL